MRKIPSHPPSRSVLGGSGHARPNRMFPMRPMKSPELIDTIVRAYDLTPNGDPIDLGGSSNLNLLFSEGDLGYVVRVYRAWVTPVRLEAIQSVRATFVPMGSPSLRSDLGLMDVRLSPSPIG
jgi:Ser/Thr protein kinase RdoA (MazF antagonist)